MKRSKSTHQPYVCSVDPPGAFSTLETWQKYAAGIASMKPSPFKDMLLKEAAIGIREAQALSFPRKPRP